MTSLKELQDWVDQVAAQTRAEEVVWCDGSQAEYDALMGEMMETGDMLELSE